MIEICRVVLEQSVKADDARFAKKLMSWAHNRRGEAFLTLAELRADKRGEMEQLALDDFEAATQVDPKNWRAWHNRGVSLGADQDYEQAIKDFDRVGDLEPATCGCVVQSSRNEARPSNATNLLPVTIRRLSNCSRMMW